MQKKNVIRETIEAIVIALVLALVIRTFVVQAFKIPSSSMEPTLLIGDHILVSKFIYGIPVPFSDKKILSFKSPKQGDVIVFEFPGNPQECKSFSSTMEKKFENAVEKKDVWRLFTDDCKDFIKRVVAVGGDTVEVRNKIVYVNGSPLADNHGVNIDPDIYPAGTEVRDNFGPYKVPEGSVFVMGDNRDRSYDSRYWGSVKLSEIKGEAFIIYWSWDGNEHWLRWRRFANIIR
ncbi:MAG: signal peptidase I [Deltaproteobacteria bacterium]|nr:signal peptidase I [Deltaproteobacteria bacterium]